MKDIDATIDKQHV